MSMTTGTLEDARIRVALIDDQPREARRYAKVVEAIGATTIIMDSLKKALAPFVDKKPLPDVLLLDWNLPWTFDDAGLFDGILARLDSYYPRDAEGLRGQSGTEGGIARLLAELYHSDHVPVFVLSQYIARDELNKAELASAGVRAIINKAPAEDVDLKKELEQNILGSGGPGRDRRLWAALEPADFFGLLHQYSSMPDEDLRAMMHEGARNPQLIVGRSETGLLDHLTCSLGRLPQARLSWSAQLRYREQAKELVPVLDPCIDTGVGVGPESEVDPELLHLFVAKDLSRIDYYTRPSEKRVDILGYVLHPRLVNDFEGKKVFAPHKFGRLMDLLKKGKGNRRYHFLDCAIKCHEDVFGPSIDTLFIARVVCKRLANVRNYRVVEVGAGTGLIAATIARKIGAALECISAIEINPTAAALAYDNICAAVGKNSQGKVSVHIASDGLAGMVSGSADLIVSNPPYLDAPEDRPAGSEATTGTELLRNLLVSEGPRVLAPGGLLVIAVSSLTQRTLRVLREEAEQVGIKWNEIAMPEVLKKTPLDLAEVHDNPFWADKLIAASQGACRFNLAAQDYILFHDLEVHFFER